MTPQEWATVIAAGGGLGGIGALVSALAALRTSKTAHENATEARASSEATLAELQPNHGSSLRDQIDALNRKTDLLAEEVILLARTQDQTLSLVRDRLNAHEADIQELKRGT